MSFIRKEGANQTRQRQRRRLTGSIRASLRALAIQLSLLSHQVSAQLELKHVDLDWLDLISRHGPR